MLLCKYFVFIHFPRTGGTFIRETLARHIPDDWEVTVSPGHATVREISTKYSAVPRFGFIRNPWDWYVSLYSGWRAVSAKDPSAFRGHVIEKVVAVSSDNSFKTIIGNMLRFPPLEKEGIGPMTWLYMNMYGLTPENLERDPENLTIKKFEGIRENIIEMLTAVGAPVSRALKDAVQHDPPTDTFERTSYQDYYDDELRALVARKDRAILQKYSYSYD
ncbi:MAG: hypothetical protein OEU36_20840 [Gammaproteobacteria bacterium]|nr:hypothetical protein [Gammaproteobacteria bacterium]